jgi:peptidoglycan/xylan/chitin deacetylase (PgdA/CDA1 family)
MARSTVKKLSKSKTASKTKRPPKAKVFATVKPSSIVELPGLSPVVAPWPKGYRSACLFTFDVDTEVSWVFRQSNDPIALSMGQYEPKVGVPMLLNMLDEAEIKSTFFVPGWVAEKYTPML